MWRYQLSELNYSSAEALACADTIRSGWLTTGPKVQAFEEEFSSFMGFEEKGFATSSATAALHLILMSLGLGPGDEVILPGLTFVSDANVIMQTGATPVFADIESILLPNSNVQNIERVITDNTKAVIVLHFAGYPAEIEPISALCKKYSLVLIEDVAHAIGAKNNGKFCGNHGDAAFFSFFGNKNLAVGEGGFAVFKEKQLNSKLKALRSHGMSAATLDRHLGRAFSYNVDAVGLNYRFDELRASLGLVQLGKLEKGNKAREALTNKYRELLRNSPVEVPFEWSENQDTPAFHILPVLLPAGAERNKVMESLKNDGIQTSIHYPAFHSFSAYRDIIKEGDLPITDEFCKRELTLPLHPKLPLEAAEEIVASLLHAVA